MVSLLRPIAAESHTLVGLEWAAPWEFWRPAEDRFPERTVEDRLRWVFHLGATHELPLVRQNALGDYHVHLARFLAFPFRASYCEEQEPLVLDGSVLVTGLCDPAKTPLDSARGILCEVVFGNTLKLPLALLKVAPWNPNCQMIDDYWHWFWNCR
ncbi:MAG: hypothetical protein ABSG68_09190 [Thermoguttaceae bacterium]|jgi:hypothetical protein